MLFQAHTEEIDPRPATGTRLHRGVGFIVALIAGAAPASAQNYKLTDLGVLTAAVMGGQATTDDSDSHAMAINASGSVVGFSGVYVDGNGFISQHAFLFKPDTPNATSGTITYLGGLPGVYCFSPEHTVGGFTTPAGYSLFDSVPRDINSSGRVVGNSWTSPDGTCPNGTIHAALWSNGTVVDLGSPPIAPAAPGSISYATSINDPGQIVGYVQTGSNADTWLYDGGFHDLGYLPSSAFLPYVLSYAVPSKINNAETLVGTSYISNLQGLLGFAHNGTGQLQATDALGTLGGATSAAFGINAAGRIVGASATATGGVHAFWINKSGKMVDLGVASQDPTLSSTAVAINASNSIVGSSSVDLTAVWQSFETGQHAVLWQNGGNLIDLNSLLDPDLKPPFGTSTIFGPTQACGQKACWELLSATGINDLGQIVGEALVVNQGEGLMPDPITGRIGARHAFLLTPPCVTAGGDSDGDGLCDSWEKDGYTAPDGTFVNLPAMGADPNHKDIFVQADYMVYPGGDCNSSGCLPGHTHKPNLDAIALVTQAFANAPVMNPDGSTGINLHVDCGPDCIMNPLTGATWGAALSQAHSLSPEIQILGDQADPSCMPTVPDSCAYSWNALHAIQATNFAPSRTPIFHYVMFAHQIGVYGAGGLAQLTGISAIPDSEFIVSLGSLTGAVGTSWEQAGTFMHELGHNLGLDHGGYDHVNYKPNYLSVMNYSFQADGLITGGINGLFDYSRFPSIPDLNESALNETIGLKGGPAIANYGTAWYCPGGGTLGGNRMDVGNANGPIDWDCDFATNPLYETSVQADINQTALALSVLHSSSDWNHLIYSGGSIGGLGFGVPASPTNVAAETAVFPDSQAPFRVSVVSPGFAQVLPGTAINETFTFTNTGVQPDTYNVAAVSTVNWWTTTGIPSTLTLAGGASQQVTVPVNVSGCIAPGATGELTLKAVSQSHASIADSGVAVLAILPNPPGTAAIPNVVGLTQAAAQTAIVAAGLVVGPVATQSSTTVAAGSVISQSPTCGVVAPGTAVSLTVSSGPPSVAVPNVVGDSQLTAIFGVRGAGITVGTITSASSTTVPQGFVISEDPAAGTLVAPGSSVNLVVSTGTVVPNVVGQTEQAAVAALTAAGLTVGTLTPQISTTVPEFVVIAEYYPAGSVVNPGTAINITFSSGSQQLVQVPDAHSGIVPFTAVGLTVGTITPMLSSTVRKEMVISQDPAVGTFAAVGTPVNVVLAAGPALIPVPNVVGQWQWYALENIYNNPDPSGVPAPFQATVTRQPSTTVRDGFVISQNPPAGTLALMFSTINLVVSSGGPVLSTVPNAIGDPSQYFSPIATVGPLGPDIGTIDAAGFAMGQVTYQISTTVPPGWVISQNPPAGTVAPWDTSVSLVVSSDAASQVPIPNVVGLTQAAAVTTLNNQVLPGIYRGDYLTYAFTTQSSATVPAGTIISQNPPPGPALLPIVANQAIGPVSLVISAGPSPVPAYRYLGQFAGTPVSGASRGKGRINPYALAIDPVSRNIIASDSSDGMIQIFDANGNYKSYFGGFGLCCGDYGTYWVGVFPGDRTGDGLFVSRPDGIAVDPMNHNIVVVDPSGNRVLIFNSGGQFLSVFGSTGSAPGQFNIVGVGFGGVAIDPTTENILVSDPGNNRIQIFNSAGVYLGQFGTFGSGNGQFFHGPTLIAVDPVSRNIVAADPENERIQIFNSAGVYQSQFGSYGQGDNQFGSITGLAIDPATHNIVVSDDGIGNENTNQPINRVRVFDATGHFLVKFGGPGSGDGQFTQTYGVAVDPATGNILVADVNDRIAIFGVGSNASATTTAVVASTNPATAGQSVTFTATVTGNSPAGTVQFMDGTANLGTPAALNAGTATLTSSTLSAGAHSITAVYSGDTSNSPSTSAVLNETILAISTTTVTSSLNPAPAGQPVTFTATVAGNNPTGTVQFMDGTANLGAPVTLGGGTGTLTSSMLSAGTHPITAVYSGDAFNVPGTSAVLGEVILAVSTTTLSASVNPANAGQTVTFTATVTGNAPTGTVQFTDGTAKLGASVALTGGTASLSSSTLSVGTHPITAVYSGDAANTPGTSAVLNEVITAAAAPVVTPPANISVPATQAGGATGAAWPLLSAFLAGGSAVDTVDPSPIHLAPQVAGAPVNNATLFPVGTTTVTFLFQDHSGSVGSATATVTVTMGTPRITGSVARFGADPSGAIYADIVLTNTGTGNGRNLMINTLVFRTLSGTGTVIYDAALSPPLPLAIGNLDLGTPVTTRVYLNVPSTVLRLSVTESGPVQDVLGVNYNYSTAESFVP